MSDINFFFINCPYWNKRATRVVPYSLTHQYFIFIQSITRETMKKYASEPTVIMKIRIFKRGRLSKFALSVS